MRFAPFTPICTYLLRVRRGRPWLAALLLAWACAVPLDAQLRVTPTEPAQGAELQFAYDGVLASVVSDTLRVRGRLRRAGSELYNNGPLQRTVALLVRGDDGVFRGAFRLPEDVVYGTFAVEDRSGSRVDHNAGRLWEVVTHGDDGRPLFDALEQRIADAIGRSWDITSATATAMTELYPESVRSWYRLAWVQRWVLGPAALDSVRREHQRRVAAFHDKFAGQPKIDAAEAEALVTYHASLDLWDTQPRWYWSRRLDDEHPRHPRVVLTREDDLRRTFGGQVDRYLQALEPLWQQLLEQDHAATERSVMVNNALNAAHRADDPGWFPTWLDRYRNLGSVRPELIPMRAASGARRAELRPFVLDVMRETEALIESLPDEYRPLDRTVAGHRLDQTGPLARTLALHAAALLAHGDSTAARARLERATRLAWEPGNWRSLAQLHLAAGDTAGAMHAFAAVAADPNSPAVLADSVTLRLGLDSDSQAWRAALDSARRTMTRLVLARATDEAVPGNVMLRGADGVERSLQATLGGRPLVLVFWDPECGWSRLALPEIQRVAAWSAARGSRVVLVLDRAPDAETREFMREKIGDDFAFDLAFDLHGDARQAFSSAYLPRYYVLNADGRIAFAGSGADGIAQIPLEVSALDF
jgi:hypothetical protein